MSSSLACPLSYLAALARLLLQLCLAPLANLSARFLISLIYNYYNYDCEEFEIFILFLWTSLLDQLLDWCCNSVFTYTAYAVILHLTPDTYRLILDPWQHNHLTLVTWPVTCLSVAWLSLFCCLIISFMRTCLHYHLILLPSCTHVLYICACLSCTFFLLYYALAHSCKLIIITNQ